jgi:thioredoxin reductase
VAAVRAPAQSRSFCAATHSKRACPTTYRTAGGEIEHQSAIALASDGGERRVAPQHDRHPKRKTEWLPAAIARDARGYVLTGDDVVKAGRWSNPRDLYLLETSVPGVLARGDVRLSPVKRVESAVGEGSMAIAFVHQHLANAG